MYIYDITVHILSLCIGVDIFFGVSEHGLLLLLRQPSSCVYVCICVCSIVMYIYCISVICMYSMVESYFFLFLCICVHIFFGVSEHGLLLVLRQPRACVYVRTNYSV